MKYKIEQLIAQNQLEQAVDLLFEIYTFCLKNNPEDDVQTSYNNLIMISGKLQSVLQDQRTGVIRLEDANIAKAQIRNSLIAEINLLPPEIFAHAEGLEDKNRLPKNDSLTLREQISLSLRVGEQKRTSNLKYYRVHPENEIIVSIIPLHKCSGNS